MITMDKLTKDTLKLLGAVYIIAMTAFFIITNMPPKQFLFWAVVIFLALGSVFFLYQGIIFLLEPPKTHDQEQEPNSTPI